MSEQYTDNKIDYPRAIQAMVELRQLVEAELRWIDANVNLDPTIRTNDFLWSYTSSLASIAHALDRLKAEFPVLQPGPAAGIVMATIYIKEHILEPFGRAAGKSPDEPIH